MSGRLPNLIIVGVQKAATTSLFSYLAQHPDICPSLIKELNFFVPAGARLNQLNSLEDYTQQFSHCESSQYRLEASPAYAPLGASVAEQLDETLDNPKIIISLRDPTSRLWSEYRFRRSQGRLEQETSFAEAIVRWRQQTDTNGGRSASTPLLAGRYGDYLDEWLDRFGDRIVIVFAEHLWADAADVLEHLLRWLGVDPALANEFDYSIENPTMQPRSRWLARQAYEIRRTSNQVLRKQPAVRAALRSAYRGVNTRQTQDVLADADRAFLYDFYADSNAVVTDVLVSAGYRDLPAWLPDPPIGACPP